MLDTLSIPPSAESGDDRLTGLHDRQGCHRLLSGLLQPPAEDGRGTAVLWIDVDRFRQINSSFGHLVGDSVLAELARRLARASGVTGTLARMGGDEFVLVLPRASATEAGHAATKLLAAIARPLGIGTTRMRPAASIGVALAQPDEAAHELLERADRAKTEAKRQGGGQFYLSGGLPRNLAGEYYRGGKYLAREELSVEESLHQALESGGLTLEYQPIVRVGARKTDIVEALMRCRVNGVETPPGRFIPVAEKTGLIHQLGDWSLVTAAGFVSRLRRAGRSLKIAVNVSRAQLIAPSFTQSLHAVLAYTDILPSQIELEITESLFMETSGLVQKNLQAALEAGFPLALDDFGTGYSSLACLKNLPAQKLKLDRAFVIDLPEDARSYGVAKAVTQLAGDLGISVVAEGVETEQQYGILSKIGVTAMQGFHIARPMPEAALLDWLEDET